jgi:adenylate cyclase
MGLFHTPKARTRRFLRLLAQRDLLPLDERADFDRDAFRTLGRRRAVVFTDTANFTISSVRHGILHFLAPFACAAGDIMAIVTRSGGELLKLEGDSLLLRYDSVAAACDGVEAVEASLRRFNRGRRPAEHVRFSYGIGWGDVIDLETDVFGLEVNLASKLGEDLARPGEILLTTAAAQALDARRSRRLERHSSLRIAQLRVDVHRLRPRKR